MRLVRTLVHETDVESVAAVLDEYGIDYLVFREDSGHEEGVLLEFPLPTQAAESVLTELRDVGSEEEPYTVVTNRPDSTRDAGSLAARRLDVLAVTLLVLGGAFSQAGSAAVVSTNLLFEQDVNRVLGGVVAEPRYDDLDVVAVSTEFRVPSLAGTGRQQMSVTLTRPAGRRYPALSRAIAERTAAETDREVTVVVEFVDQQRYPPGGED